MAVMILPGVPVPGVIILVVIIVMGVLIPGVLVTPVLQTDTAYEFKGQGHFPGSPEGPSWLT